MNFWLFLLNIVYQIGPSAVKLIHCNVIVFRRNLEKLTNRLKDNELSTYSLYLQYERIKYYLKLKQFFRTISLSKKMYDDANALGSIAWQVNALMMAAISESRLGNSMNCMKILEVVIPLSRTLGNDEVTQFLSKVMYPSLILFDFYVLSKNIRHKLNCIQCWDLFR